MRAKQETYCHISTAFVILYSMLVGLMKGLVTHALLIALPSYCDLADHCPHAINLNVFRASFEVPSQYNLRRPPCKAEYHGGEKTGACVLGVNK